jgi:hypothetical protein
MIFISKPVQHPMNKPLQINKLLGGSPHARLLSRARSLLQLENRLHALLPAPLTEHCRILSIRDTTLVLAADSPVWAARLRFHTPLLLKQLARIQGVRLRRVRIRVRPPEAATAPRHRHVPNRRSAAGTAALQQAAQTVSDPELKTALLRLANRKITR